MTSSARSTDPAGSRAGAAGPQRAARRAGLPLWAVLLAIVAVALIAGWIFVLWHHRFRLTASAVLLMLGWASVLSAVYFLWRTADNADLDDHEDWWKPTGRLEELVREKRSLLKAIKETELDRDTGKLSDADADDIIVRYRVRAIEVIKAIEEAEAGIAGDVRARIERDVRARVEVDRGGRRPRKAAAAEPATAAEPAAAAEPAIAAEPGAEAGPPVEPPPAAPSAEREESV
jgi:hypothetical protein